MPNNAFAAGLGDYKIVTTLRPEGKERMNRLMNMVKSGRFDPTPLMTHRFSLDNIVVGRNISLAEDDLHFVGCAVIR